MNRIEISTLVEQLRNGEISRRGFMRRATALGMSAAAAGVFAREAGAQTPASSPAASPAATGEVIKSPSEEEGHKLYDEGFKWEEAKNQGGELVQVMTTDISTTNPILASDTYSGWITSLVYDGLIGQSVVDGNYYPTALVKEWEIAGDGITYTLKLRDGIKWHDGKPFTADDVMFSYDMALDEKSQSPRKGTIEGSLASYEKVDDMTLKFVAKAPNAVFIGDVLNQFGIMPKHVWEGVTAEQFPTDGGSTGTDPKRVIGTGAFKFIEWKQGEHVTLETNKEYWDTKNVPVIDKYIYQVVVDPNSALASLQTGESDVAEVPFSQANKLRESNPELQILDYDTLGFNFFHCNQDPAKLDLFVDPKVRQALYYALDRDMIAQTVYDGFAERADGTQPKLSIAYDPNAVKTVYKHDEEKAKALLKEAGWEDTDGDGIVEKDGKKFSFEMYYSEGVATYQTQIPYMQQAFRKVGIEAIPAAIPFPTLLDSTDAGNYQMAVQGFTWSVDGGQDAMFQSTMLPPSGFNMMRYKNETYDSMVQPSKEELVVEKRVGILKEMSNIVNEDAAIGINVFRKNIMGGAPRVHNFFPNGYSTLHWLSRAWVDAQ